MKILSIIILSVACSLNTSAQIKIKGHLEIGYYTESYSLNTVELIPVSQNEIIELTNIESHEFDTNYERVYKVTRIEYLNSFYSDIVLNISFKNFHLEQQLFNIFRYPGNGYTFEPLEVKYKTRLYYKWKYLDIGAEHMCLHPIITTHNKTEAVTRRMSHDKIFIRLTFNAN